MCKGLASLNARLVALGAQLRSREHVVVALLRKRHGAAERLCSSVAWVATIRVRSTLASTSTVRAFPPGSGLARQQQLPGPLQSGVLIVPQLHETLVSATAVYGKCSK
jgi:hypothetical protein